MCSIGHGTIIQENKKQSVRGTSLQGVCDGIQPPRSPKSLLAFEPLFVTVVHDNGDFEKCTAQCHVISKSNKTSEVRSTVAEEPFSPRLKLLLPCIWQSGNTWNLTAERIPFSAIRSQTSYNYLPQQLITHSTILPPAAARRKRNKHIANDRCHNHQHQIYEHYHQ